MKTISTIALSALLLGSAGVAEAGPLDFLFKKNDHRHDHRPGHRDDRFDRDRGRPRMSTEARAQLRLRELGYYRGPIDGSFGRGSKSALVRFQRDHRLRPTGWLDERTRRALRL
jgi:hypothetical protein